MLQWALISPHQPTKSDLQYTQFVKPSFDEFILPSKKHADVIIPRGADNDVAIDLIVQHIQTKLGQHDLCKIYPNVFVVHATYQVTTLISTLKLYVLNFCRKRRKMGNLIDVCFTFAAATRDAHSYTRCQNNKTWFCFLCRQTYSFGIKTSIIISLWLIIQFTSRAWCCIMWLLIDASACGKWSWPPSFYWTTGHYSNRYLCIIYLLIQKFKNI